MSLFLPHLWQEKNQNFVTFFHILGFFLDLVSDFLCINLWLGKNLIDEPNVTDERDL